MKTYFLREMMRETKKNLSRFLTFALISALGVGCLIGFKVTPILMDLWIDDLYISQNFMDFRLTSEIGFSEENLEYLLEIDGVKGCQGTYQGEMMLSDQVLKVQSYHTDSSINELIIESGQYPENTTECVVELSFLEETGYKIGDSIKISEVEFIEDGTYTIVGVGKSPLYIAPYRGTASLGDGQVDGVIFFHESVFMGEYDEIFLTLLDDTLENQGEMAVFHEKLEEYTEISWETQSEVLISELEDTVKSLQMSYSFQVNRQKENLMEYKLSLAYATEDISFAWSEYEKVKETLTEEEREIEKENINKLEEIYDVYLLLYEDAEVKAEAKVESIKKSLGQAERDLQILQNGGWKIESREENLGYLSYIDDGEQFFRLSLVFPMIFFVVTALLTWGATSQQVLKKRVEIGTLRALGYGKLEIIWKYTLYGLSSSVFGGLLGILLGLYVIPTILYYGWSHTYVLGAIQFEMFPEITIPIFLLALMVGSVPGGLSCLSVVMSEPSNLMRPKAPRPGGEILLEKSYLLWHDLKFRQKVTLRNLFRDPKRVGLTICSIGFVTGIMVSAFGLREATSEATRKQFEEIYLHTTQIKLRDDVTTEERLEVQGKLSEFGLSQDYTAFGVQSVAVCNVNGETWSEINLYTVENQEALGTVFNMRLSKWLTYNMPQNGIILPVKVADTLNLKLGDEVILQGDFGEASGILAGRSEQYQDLSLFMSHSYYEIITGNSVVINEFWVDYDDIRVNTEEYRSQLDETLVALDGVSQVNHREAQRDFYTASIKTLDYSVNLIFISACLLAFVVLSYLNSSNVGNRRGELATLKILGFTDFELGAYVYQENIILAFFGVTLGMVFGQNFHYWLIEIVEMPHLMLYRGLHLYRFLAGAGMTMIFVILINGMMFWKLKKLDMTRNLQE